MFELRNAFGPVTEANADLWVVFSCKVGVWVQHFIAIGPCFIREYVQSIYQKPSRVETNGFNHGYSTW